SGSLQYATQIHVSLLPLRTSSSHRRRANHPTFPPPLLTTEPQRHPLLCAAATQYH
ncbi:hypothetical protein A2U01_0112904, partial [Trifolium medium]|nr:hypothetical protein [Trifolium medium]